MLGIYEGQTRSGSLQEMFSRELNDDLVLTMMQTGIYHHV